MDTRQILTAMNLILHSSTSLKKGEKKSFFEEFSMLAEKNTVKTSHGFYGITVEIDGRIFITLTRKDDGVMSCKLQSFRQRIFMNNPLHENEQKEAAELFDRLSSEIPLS